MKGLLLKRRTWIIILLLSLVISADILLLQNLNTLVWPYLWPRPAIFIIIGVVAAAIWLPELFRSIWAVRIIGFFMVFIGQSYVIHSFDMLVEYFSLIALIHFVGILGTFSVMALNYINQFTPRNNRQAPPLPDELPYVAAVVPTYGEPVDILEDTVVALKALDYPADRLYIFVSDDGHRPEVRKMCRRQRVHYNEGARKDAKAGNLNSALEHIAAHFPQATLILTQDADEIIDPSFLKKTVGYFNDPNVALVQTPKEAIAPPGDPFGVRDRVFYDVVQPGRNGAGAAFSCGSGVVWRIEAVRAIGGFATWNIVEDLTTSYFLHAAGFRSEYHNEILTIGLAPDDIPGLLKQRGTWAVDTWRLFLFKNPLQMPGLTLRQRLQYTELGLFYVSTAFFMPLLMFTPVTSLLTGHFVNIEGSALFPWLAASILYYVAMSRGIVEFFKRMWQYWVGHSPTYFKAFWIAVRSRHRKPSYKVTRKTRQAGFYGLLIWPQFAYLLLGTAAILNGLVGLTDVDLGVRLTNIGIVIFFMYMVSGICAASLYGLELPLAGALHSLQSRTAQTVARLTAAPAQETPPVLGGTD